MPVSIEAEIARLENMDRDQLRDKWQSALKQQPPLHIRRSLLLPLLAYKLQEQAYGGLKPEVKRRLRELADSFAQDPKGAAAKIQSPLRIKAGTTLIRQWQGMTHHVTVSEQGFEYKGQRYKSLSEIARLITGTRWSGPLFFGLKQNKKPRVKK